MTVRGNVSSMSKSYYPSDRTGQIAWHKNFAQEFPKVGATLGFTAGEMASAVNDSNYAVYLLETLGPEIESDPMHAAYAVLEGPSRGSYVDLPASPEAPVPVRPGIDTRRQARVERIKASAAFTFDVIGKQLKVVGGKFDPKNYKAELGQARQTGPNTVVIPFRKAGGDVAGINLYRQRKGESAPQLVSFFKRTPALDPIPVVAPGKSEERNYTARGVMNGKEIGHPSDVVTVTVTG
jgi:hypothetical protein